MSRRKKLRQAKEKQIFIFSEGDTEICYFNQLKSFFKKQNLKILGNKGQLSGIDLEKINRQKETIYGIIKNKIDFTERDIKSTNSVIFYFLDIDGFNRSSYTQREIDFLKANFEDDNFKIFFSNKDFELWILLHLNNYKKEDGEYIKKIENITKEEYKKGNCNIDFFKYLVENNLQNAIERGKNLEIYQTKSQGKSELKLMNPYTEVYKIFEELEI